MGEGHVYIEKEGMDSSQLGDKLPLITAQIQQLCVLPALHIHQPDNLSLTIIAFCTGATASVTC